jgi:UvrB domain 3
MVVCRDKEACVLYKVAFDAALQERLGGEELDELTRIVISEDLAHDPEAVKRHYLGGDRKSAIEDFKRPAPLAPDDRARPEQRFRRTEIVIVCDMLLTGFDAAILQTMYLDKGMRDHTLLQAVARVNRPYKDIKQSGLILDYFGVFEDLNEALNFDRNELGEVAYPFSALRDRFREQITALLGLGRSRPGQRQRVLEWRQVHAVGHHLVLQADELRGVPKQPPEPSTSSGTGAPPARAGRGPPATTSRPAGCRGRSPAGPTTRAVRDR